MVLNPQQLSKQKAFDKQTARWANFLESLFRSPFLA